MSRPYFHQLVDCLRDTLQQMERGEDGDSPEVEELKRKILLLLADIRHEWPGANVA